MAHCVLLQVNNIIYMLCKNFNHSMAQKNVNYSLEPFTLSKNNKKSKNIYMKTKMNFLYSKRLFL